jgi:hypothetical protein
VNWKLRIAWMGILMANRELATASEDATIRVFLYDYAHVSPAVFEGAKAVAAAIIERAGVEVAWTECTVRGEEAPKVSPCDRFIQGDIQLRILTAYMAKRAGTPRDCLGYAVTKSGSVAAVYYHRAVEVKREGLTSLHRILGAAMAHEIGHLLLAESNHSPTGLMRAAWNKKDLKALERGSLTFSDVQARRMASMAAKRVGERARLAATPDHHQIIEDSTAQPGVFPEMAGSLETTLSGQVSLRHETVARRWLA